MPLLIFANKMDEKGSLAPGEISQALSLDLIRSRSWHIGASCALTGDGLQDGVEWLSIKIKEYLEAKNK